MQQNTGNSKWTSRRFAWIATAVVELAILVSAMKDPIPWIAAIQYALLVAPPVILVLAIRGDSYAPVLTRLMTVFIAVTTLDLFYLR